MSRRRRNASVETRPARTRRLSVLRIGVAIGLIAATAAGTTLVVREATEATPDTSGQWYAPYIDVTLPPFLDFQDPVVNPTEDVVLAFIVGADADGCVPAWGAKFGLDDAAGELDLDRRIARYRNRGGNIIVSFGGAVNDELAVSCPDPAKLLDAYRSVVDRYDVTTLDFDIEGDALIDTASIERRAEAVAALQAERADSDKPLAVWLTLPVAPTGMLEQGVAAIDAMLTAGVDLTGVNVMTMNYGSARESQGIVDASMSALDATHRQLSGAYQRAGVNIEDAALWTKIGATPMIGQNDYRPDRFDIKDVERFFDNARSRGIGRFSMWSLNRDQACGTNVDRAAANNHCSGVDQDPLEFTSIFDTLEGRPSEPTPIEDIVTQRAEIIDDPATSPYPIWREGREFEEGAKVVWRQDVYEAKWWNVGEPPDAPIVNEWDSPWRLLGPVIPGEVTPTTTTTLAPGTYPTWSRTEVYDSGDRVQWNGVGYEAKWYSRNDTPGADVDNDWETPWAPVGAPE